MTLEQAIEFCLHMSEEQYKSAHNIIRGDYPEYEAAPHFRLASEYKQIAEWLTVLKKQIDDIGEVPAADVQHVRHGRWIECRNELDKKCSCCNKVHGTIYEREPFCPNCGARMDLEEGDANERS